MRNERKSTFVMDRLKLHRVVKSTVNDRVPNIHSTIVINIILWFAQSEITYITCVCFVRKRNRTSDSFLQRRPRHIHVQITVL